MTGPIFAVIGESLVDIIRSGHSTSTSVGGSPLNVAVGLARLGNAAKLVTQIGGGQHASQIRRHLDENQVHTVDVAQRHQIASSATGIIGNRGSAEYAFAFEWNSFSPSILGGDALGALHCGSLSAIHGDGAANVLAAYQASAASGSITTFDPNIRPTMLHAGNRVTESVERYVCVTFVVKASDEDISHLYPGRNEKWVIDRWLGLGARAVVITQGSRGAIGAAEPGNIVHQPTLVRSVLDTVGAGDSFMAALVDQVVHGGPEIEMRVLLRRAAVAAAITCSRRGAQPPTRDEINDWSETRVLPGRGESR